jgi:hypothetical protein
VGIPGVADLLDCLPNLPGALCASHDAEMWFADDPATVARAREICAACPERVACLAWAVEHGEPFGVWGGERAHERLRPKPVLRTDARNVRRRERRRLATLAQPAVGT